MGSLHLWWRKERRRGQAFFPGRLTGVVDRGTRLRVRYRRCHQRWVRWQPGLRNRQPKGSTMFYHQTVSSAIRARFQAVIRAASGERGYGGRLPLGPLS